MLQVIDQLEQKLEQFIRYSPTVALQAHSYSQINLFIISVALIWNKLYQVCFGFCRVLFLTSLWSAPEMGDSSTTGTQEVTMSWDCSPLPFPELLAWMPFLWLKLGCSYRRSDHSIQHTPFQKNADIMYTNIITHKLKEPYQILHI